MIEITLHGKNGSRTIEIKTPRGNLPTRHVRTRKPVKSEAKVSAHPVDRKDTALPKPQPELPPSAPPLPVCPVLKALRVLTDVYPDGDNYFILDEIFLTIRQECDMSRDALLETLRAYYRDGQIAFRHGYGSQLQFALEENR